MVSMQPRSDPPCGSGRQHSSTIAARSRSARLDAALSAEIARRIEGSGLDRPYTLASVNECARQPDDLDVDAAAFWLDTDLEKMLSTVKPYEGPDEFIIEDLTDDEWDRFVAALSE